METDKLVEIDNYLRDAIMKIEKIREEIDELRRDKTSELPKLFDGEDGGFIVGYDELSFDDNVINLDETNIIFRTLNEANKYLDKSEQIHRLLKKMSVEWNGDWVADWEDESQNKYYVTFDCENKKYHVEYGIYSNSFHPLFKSKKLAGQAIEKLKQLGY